MSELPRQHAVGTAKLAEEFLLAAERVDFDEAPLAGSFLLGHCLELLFKATLITEGTTDRCLRRIGHDLVAAHRLSRVLLPSKSLMCDPNLEQLVAMLDPYSSAKALEYVAPGYQLHPELSQACGLVRNLLSETRPWINKRVRRHLAKGAV